MTFAKGNPKPENSGRKPGVVNHQTADVRSIIAECARRLGGLERLIEWAKSDDLNERIFWSQMWLRLAPLKIQGTGEHGEIEVSFKIKDREELVGRLVQQGLPTHVFGVDKPLLELKPVEDANGNASEGSEGGVDRAGSGNGRGDAETDGG